MENFQFENAIDSEQKLRESETRCLSMHPKYEAQRLESKQI